jgi:protein-arginine kinase activator protein McsA
MFHCPLTGQVCNEERAFMISESIGQFTQTTACCRKCSAHYVEQRNNIAAQQANQLKAHQNALTAQAMVAAQKMIKADQQQGLKGINLPEVLGQILGLKPKDGKYVIEKVTLPIIDEIVKCGKCGSTVNDIIASNKFGCPECYNSFSKQVLQGIGNAQMGANQHTGKTPKKHVETEFVLGPEANKAEVIPMDIEGHIMFLREQMDQLTKDEQYEKAAQCRDLITKLGGDPKVVVQENTNEVADQDPS